MKSFHLGATCALTLLFSVPSFAADPYIGGAGMVLSAKESEVHGDASLAGLRFNFGADLYRYFAVEGQIGVGLIRDTLNQSTTSTNAADTNPDDLVYKVKLEGYAAAYVKGILPVSSVANLYALAGIAHTMVKVKSNMGPDSNDYDTSPSFGLGGEVAVTNTLHVTGDIMALDVTNGATVVSLSAGARWNF